MMVKKITTFLLLIVILTSLFIAVFSGIALAKKGPLILCDYEYCGSYERIGYCSSGGYWGVQWVSYRYEVMPPNCNPVRIGVCGSICTRIY